MLDQLGTVVPDTAQRRPAYLWAGIGAGVVVLLYVVLYVAAGSGIARGTTVAGVDIGGKSRAAARATLAAALGPKASRPVPVRLGDATATVSPRRAGLSFDAAATVANAPARSWNPVSLVRAVLGGGEVDPVVAADDAKLGAEVARLATSFDRPVAEASVAIKDGAVVVSEPAAGRRLRTAQAATTLKDELLTGSRPLRLPTTTTSPAVSAAEVARARKAAELALSGPVRLSVAENRTVTVTPKQLAGSLTFVADAQHRLQPRVDGAALHATLGDRLRNLEDPAKDATFRIRGGKPRVVASRDGREVSPADLSAAVLSAMARTGDARTATVALTPARASLTTEQARALGVVERVSTFTTYYPTDFPPRLTNIHRAADLMDNTLVLPGDTFSLNQTVGERTAERGFAAGFIIDNGKLEVDFGGGVSQLATTTFNAGFFAGLELVEHHPHSFYISRYPEGRESTVAWGVKDVRIKNDSPHGIFITTSYTSGSVTVSMYGTTRYDVRATKSARYAIKPYRVVYDDRPPGTTPGSCVAGGGVPGFKVDVYRILSQHGQQVSRQRFHTVYQPENEIRCGKPPSAKPKPKPSPSASPVPSD